MSYLPTLNWAMVVASEMPRPVPKTTQARRFATASDEAARGFRNDVARDSDMMSPGVWHPRWRIIFGIRW
jgi:hypothetical protein